MPAIQHQVLIRSDPAKIYEALTTQEGLSLWWTADCAARPEVGSVNEFRFGGLVENRMRVSVLEPSRRVEWECLQSVPGWIGTRITFDIAQKGGLTFLNFRHEGYQEEGEFFANCSFNWAKALMSLRDLCETGKGCPFDPAKDLEEVRAVTGNRPGPPKADAPAPDVTGIGGVFFKCHNPKKLMAWYSAHLGIPSVGGEAGVFQWREAASPENVAHTVWGLFTEDTAYFGPSEKPFMLNYRVRDLERLLARLREKGVTVIEGVETYEYGKFGWIMDPEGNKVELWEPNDAVFRRVNKLP
jgi:uncharacterized protein YndB with AHSA1/START domain/predicted enzyme related to lactoylglutathione lyase